MALSKKEIKFNELIDEMEACEKMGQSARVIQLLDKITKDYKELLLPDRELLLKGVRGRNYAKLGKYAEAMQVLGEILQYNYSNNIPVGSSTHMYRWLCAYYEGDEEKATQAHLEMTDEKAINLIRETTMQNSNTTSTENQINVQEAIEKVDGFINTLDSGGVPPFDNQQDVIEQLGNASDPIALPVLRQALSSAIEYQRRAETELARTDPNTTRANHLDMMRMTTKNMEKRLRQAITSCTPEGEIPIYSNTSHTPEEKNTVQTKKWWEFWK